MDKRIIISIIVSTRSFETISNEDVIDKKYGKIEGLIRTQRFI